MSVRTANGGLAAVGRELCHHNTTHGERQAILAREEELRKWRRGLPKRKKPEHEKPGPVTIIDMRYQPC